MKHSNHGKPIPSWHIGEWQRIILLLFSPRTASEWTSHASSLRERPLTFIPYLFILAAFSCLPYVRDRTFSFPLHAAKVFIFNKVTEWLGYTMPYLTSCIGQKKKKKIKVTAVSCMIAITGPTLAKKMGGESEEERLAGASGADFPLSK